MKQLFQQDLKVVNLGLKASEVLDRLHWLGTEFFSTIQVAVRELADANLKQLMAQALHMGDELHNRNAAASALLFKPLKWSWLMMLQRIGRRTVVENIPKRKKE